MLGRVLFWAYFVFLNVVYFLPQINQKPDLDKEEEAFIRIDYLQHLGVFVICMLLLLLVYRPTYMIRGMLLVCLYAPLAEFLQQFVPGRAFNPVDLVFNLVGCVVGILIYVLYRKMVPRNKTG